MNRPLRLLASLAATIALAFAITFAVVKAQAEPPAGEIPPGALALATSERTAGADDADYDLSKLPVLSQVIYYVDKSYVDPKRIDPKAMVVAALDGVEKQVAEVLVEGDAASGRLTVTAGSARRVIDISSLKSIFDVRVVMGDVMGFIQKNLVAQKNLREIEYAAVGGMLSTLDPHSVLLDPRAFRDMKDTTRGEFGGVGFVISVRDGNLTVMRVIKNTPADRAGLKARDVISRIEEQSTVSMDVQDAVERLRGKPNTKVSMAVMRSGWSEPHKISVVRDIIKIESVPQAKLLDRGIGYVKITQFTANTTRDLLSAVQQQRTQAGGQLRGLVLDLRSNPGGLLDQAIQISDLFLSEGVIVKTVGGDRIEVREAHGDRDDLASLPLVVLVNNASASASEIVAGALKNNNRALIVGRQTFGKGSVQVLNDFPLPGKPAEDLAVKLTVAQYLTPGDVSIQEVGITPDVALLPGRALKDAINFFAPPRIMGEVDLDRHLSNPGDLALSQQEAARRAAERAAHAEKAPLELRYLLDEKEDLVAKALKADERREAAARAHGEAEVTPEQQEDEDVEANQDTVVEDYQIRFAKELLARHPFADRPRLLEAAKVLVGERRAEEEARLAQRLEALGLDWSAGPISGTPRAVITVTPAAGKKNGAGETLSWTVTVENRGDGPYRRLRAWSSVQKNGLLDRREFVFGTIQPGEKRSWTVPVRTPRGMDSRHDEVKLHFEDEGGRAPADITAGLDMVEAARPSFAFSTQVEDQQAGNGDGQVQRGEEVSLRVDVRNRGAGPTGEKTYVSIKNLGDEKIFIEKGRAVLGVIKAGEVKSALLQLEVKKGLKASVVPLRVTIYDEKNDEYVVRKVDLPVKGDGWTRAAATGAVRVSAAQAVIRAGAAPEAQPIAVARKGTVLAVQGRFGDTLRVVWQKGRFGFVSAADAETSSAKPGGAVTELWQSEPPLIEMTPDPAQGPVVVDGDRLHVQGTAVVSTGSPIQAQVRDLFIYVNDQKVFFKLPPEPSAKVEFAADVPLKPGNNVVTVFAREDDELQSHRTIVVYRRVPDMVAHENK